MKALIIVLIISLVTVISCTSSDTASKSDKQKVTAEEKAKKAEEVMKLEEEKAAREKETKMAKEELEKKKADHEKQIDEMKAVKERLKEMGMGAVFVPVTKDGNVFLYPGGKTAVIRSKVADDITLRSLNLAIDKQIKKSNSDLDYYTSGLGGFETCMGDRFFILYMYKDQGGSIQREWYELMDKCN